MTIIEFQENDMVLLLLLPTSSKKLLAQWQVPYQVLKRLGGVNYLIDMPHRRKRKQVHHIHLLKKWEPLCALGLAACEVDGNI